MARNVSLNGTSFTIPQTGDSGWSLTGGVDDYLVALASGVLTKAGGSFTLTGDVNLGAAKGLIGPYYTSATTGPAASGVVRLAKTDAVGWRNNAGAADLALAIDGSDNLTFNGLKVGLSGNIVNADISPSAAIAYSKLALSNSIVNSDIASAAAIAYSKLALSGSIVNADVSASAAIAYSKLSLGGSIVNSDVSGTAAIAYSKLNLATSIQNSDVSATAAIAYSKLNLAASIATADLAAGLLVPVAKGGTGVTTSTGTGSVVLSSSPTLTTPSFSSIVNTGTLTLPTSTDTLVGRATTDTLTNKTLSGNIATNLVSGAATITLPTTTGTLATLANAETLTNKTLSTGTSITAGKITTAVAEVDPADNTKQWNATLSAAATATATTFAFAQTANRTLTMPDATDTLVGKATTDTLTNKTLTAPVQSSYEDFTEVSTPANPGAGKLRVYAKTDDKVYTLTSAGVETALGAGAGGGSGELNLVGSPSTAANWTNTGTTGAGANAPATTTTAGDLPLSGIVGTAIKITSGTSAGAEASNYTSYAFTTPASYAVKTKVEFWMRPGSNFVASEWTVSVYAGSTRQALTTDSSSVTYLPNANGKFTTYFDAQASTAYTVRFARVTNAGANAGVLNVANVIVGPGIQPQGAVVGPEIAWTPTISNFGTVTNVTFQYSVAGEYIIGKGKFTAGASGAGALASFTLPNNWTTSEGQVTGVNFDIGRWERAATASPRQGILLTAASGPNANIYFGSTDAAVSPFTPQNASSIVAGNEVFDISFRVRIDQLIGSGTVNLAQNAVEYAYNTSTSATASDTTSFANGPAGFQIGSITAGLSRDVQWLAPRQNGDVVTVEISPDQVNWYDIENFGGSAFKYQTQGTTTYGIAKASDGAGLPSNKTRINFGQYAVLSSTATYGAAGLSYAGIGANTYWLRVKKVAAGQALGFSSYLAPSTSTPAGASGLVPASGLPGRTDGNAVPAGNVGENYSDYAAVLSTTQGADRLSFSRTLQPGTWLINANASIQPNGGTTGAAQAKIITGGTNSSGTITGGTNNGNNGQDYTAIGGTLSSGQNYPVGGMTKTVNISVATTYNFTMQAASVVSGFYGIMAATYVRIA